MIKKHSFVLGFALLAFSYFFIPFLDAETNKEKADVLYKVALVAMEKGDLVLALRDLREAANLAPGNPLIHYNLAIVLSRQDCRAEEASKSLEKAIKLGLTGAEKQKADDLRVTLTYQKQKDEEAEGCRFIDNFDKTISDKKTGLMWAAVDNGSDIHWDNAKTYCDDYVGGGYEDWRMPTIDELRSLFDAGKNFLPNDECGGEKTVYHLTSLIHITCCCLWSSETSGASDARYFAFGTGKVSAYDRSNSIFKRVLPVRPQK